MSTRPPLSAAPIFVIREPRARIPGITRVTAIVFRPKPNQPLLTQPDEQTGGDQDTHKDQHEHEYEEGDEEEK